MSAYCVICLKALKLTYYNKTLTKITKKTLKRHKILSASLIEIDGLLVLHCLVGDAL